MAPFSERTSRTSQQNPDQGDGPATAGNNPNQDPTRIFELVSFPTENDDEVQLAENYSTPGTKIIWEENPYTTTNPDESKTDERKAVIETEGNIFYLSGDTIYHFGAKKIDEEPMFVFELPDDVGMYDVTVDEPTPFDGKAVTNVLIATEKVQADAPEAQGAAEHTENVFAHLDGVISSVGGGTKLMPTKLSRGDEPYLGAADPELPEYMETYRIREKRRGTTNAPREIRELEEIIPPIRAHHERGTMSPQPPVVPVRAGGRKDGDIIGYERNAPEYTPRTLEGVIIPNIKKGVSYLPPFVFVRLALNRYRKYKRDQTLIKKGNELLAEQNMSDDERDAEHERQRREAKKMPSKL